MKAALLVATMVEWSVEYWVVKMDVLKADHLVAWRVEMMDVMMVV